MSNPASVPWRSRAARIYQALGTEPAERDRLLAEEQALAAKFGTGRAIGVALLARAEITAGNDAVDPLFRAVDTLDSTPARLELARALTQLGAALCDKGDKYAARDALRRAARLADECGATLLARHAHERLLSAGGRPRRGPKEDGVATLTPAEMRVASLAGAGMSNRQIAATLRISQRTAEVHLSHIYRKFAIHDRSQLRDALPGDRREPVPADPDRAPSRGGERNRAGSSRP